MRAVVQFATKAPRCMHSHTGGPEHRAWLAALEECVQPAALTAFCANVGPDWVSMHTANFKHKFDVAHCHGSLAA